MKSRVFVAVVGVPLLCYVVLLAPKWVMVFALALLCGFAALELLECVGVTKASPFLARLSVFFSGQVVLYVDYWPDLLPVFLTFCCLLAFAIAVGRAGDVSFAQLMASLFTVIVLPYSFTSFLRIGEIAHRGYLLLPFVLSFACDTCAFFAGSTLGYYKLAPRVSPNKTVEGSLGGLAGSLAGSLVFALVMNRWFGQSLSYPRMALFGLLGSIIAQLGDLSFSLIKREFGIKDYGKIFLAHGGVLDRFDSVIFVAPVVALLLPYLL